MIESNQAISWDCFSLERWRGGLKQKIINTLCLLGIHRWIYTGRSLRYRCCPVCGKKQYRPLRGKMILRGWRKRTVYRFNYRKKLGYVDVMIEGYGFYGVPIESLDDVRIWMHEFVEDSVGFSDSEVLVAEITFCGTKQRVEHVVACLTTFCRIETKKGELDISGDELCDYVFGKDNTEETK
ncbi:MAG: hypothetical protein KGD60_10705 [Candidatus Thorarchaeota archaeon]|nr:hypothetical protein [Candidatus Thorarchaeota archaeon]